LARTRLRVSYQRKYRGKGLLTCNVYTNLKYSNERTSTYSNTRESTGPGCRKYHQGFFRTLKNGKGDYRNQEQIARAIELGKFLSSKEEIAAADDVRLFRIKEDIAIRAKVWQKEQYMAQQVFAGAKDISGPLQYQVLKRAKGRCELYGI
jgi:hypothetical protein